MVRVEQMSDRRRVSPLRHFVYFGISRGTGRASHQFRSSRAWRSGRGCPKPLVCYGDWIERSVATEVQVDHAGRRGAVELVRSDRSNDRHVEAPLSICQQPEVAYPYEASRKRVRQESAKELGARDRERTKSASACVVSEPERECLTCAENLGRGGLEELMSRYAAFTID